MNTDDLRQTLATMAREVESTDETSRRLQAVDARVSRARRQRIGAATGCAAAAAVVGLVLPSLVSTGDGPGPAGPSTATQTPAGLATVEDRGTRFYVSPAGDTLLGEKMGRPGTRAVTLRVVPTTTDLAYRSVCWRAGSQSSRLMYDVTINGKPIKSASCNGERYGPLLADSTFGGGSPTVNAAGWRDYVGVVPGKPMTLRVSVAPGVQSHAGGSPIQLGIALYADTGAMLHDHGVWFAREVVSDGHTYTLVRRGFHHSDGVRGHMSVDLPSTPEPLYLVHGVADAGSGYDFVGDSSGAHSDTRSGSSEGGLARAGQEASRMSVTMHGKPGALMYILAYRQVD
jgi:hypothetical protein